MARPYTEQHGPRVPLSCRTPEQCFAVFFDNSLWQFLVDRTNEYAQKKILYSSPLLAVELGKVGITVTGTVQPNRKGLPESFRNKKEESRGTVTGYRADDMLAFYWVDERKMFVITTKHELSMVDVPPRYTQLHTHTIHSLVPRLYSAYSFFTLVCETSDKMKAGNEAMYTHMCTGLHSCTATCTF